MTKEDIAVAEAMGWEFYQDPHSKAIVPVPPTEEKPDWVLRFDKVAVGDIGINDRVIPTAAPPSFISEPTGETDWIVLEWARGKKGTVVYDIESTMRVTWIEQDKKGRQFIFLRDYKPGMYARALLEVRSD